MNEAKKPETKAAGVHVAIRVRPSAAAAEEPSCLKVADDGHSVTVKEVESSEKRLFLAEQVFDVDSRQQDLTNFCIKPAVERIINGVNAAIMCYGQTGSGKTYTMEGSATDPGVVPNAFIMLFQRIREIQMNSIKADDGCDVTKFEVRASYVQIYMERVYDLLVDDHAENQLHLQEDGDSSIISIIGATNVRVESAAEASALLQRGTEARITAETAMNRASSRSHSIFVLTIHRTDTLNHNEAGCPSVSTAADETDPLVLAMCRKKHVVKPKTKRVAQMYLVDLAGSECVSKSGCQGLRLKEAGHINRSLLTLGRCVNALAIQGLKQTRRCKSSRRNNKKNKGKAQEGGACDCGDLSSDSESDGSGSEYGGHFPDVIDEEKKEEGQNDGKQEQSGANNIDSSVVADKRETEASNSAGMEASSNREHHEKAAETKDEELKAAPEAATKMSTETHEKKGAEQTGNKKQPSLPPPQQQQQQRRRGRRRRQSFRKEKEKVDLYVPYRDSKLTRLLKNALGGNSETFLCVCVSPDQLHKSETLAALRFGKRAMAVQTTPTANLTRSCAALRSQIIARQESLRILASSVAKRMLWIKQLYHAGEALVREDGRQDDDWWPRVRRCLDEVTTPMTEALAALEEHDSSETLRMVMKQHTDSNVTTPKTLRDSRLSSNKEGVRVFLRIKPPAPEETSSTGNAFPMINAWEPDLHRVVFGMPALSVPLSSHVYKGGLFSPIVTQSKIYGEVGAPLVDSIFDGTDAAVLCYGQTGTGKTYTMLGPNGGVRTLQPENSGLPRCHKTALLLDDSQGLMPRALADIFGRIAKATAANTSAAEKALESVCTLEKSGSVSDKKIIGFTEDTFSVALSVVELYNETCRDLLVPRHRGEGTDDWIALRKSAPVDAFVDGQWLKGTIIRVHNGYDGSDDDEDDDDDDESGSGGAEAGAFAMHDQVTLDVFVDEVRKTVATSTPNSGGAAFVAGDPSVSIHETIIVRAASVEKRLSRPLVRLRGTCNTSRPRDMRYFHDCPNATRCVCGGHPLPIINHKCPSAATVRVRSPEDALHQLHAAMANRVTGATAQNRTSSRSHALVFINVVHRRRFFYHKPPKKMRETENSRKNSALLQFDESDDQTINATLTLVDLAGSEAVRTHNAASGSTDPIAHERAIEGRAINKSLLSLRQVMRDISKNSSATAAASALASAAAIRVVEEAAIAEESQFDGNEETKNQKDIYEEMPCLGTLPEEKKLPGVFQTKHRNQQRKKQKKPKSAKQVWMEEATILKSNTAPSVVVAHPPYRNSKLTMLLKPTLEGGGRTAIVLNCSAAIHDAAASLSTLYFGDAASRVTKSIQKNRIVLPASRLERCLKATEECEALLLKAIQVNRKATKPILNLFSPTLESSFDERCGRISAAIRMNPLLSLSSDVAPLLSTRVACNIAAFVTDAFTLVQLPLVCSAWNSSISGSMKVWRQAIKAFFVPREEGMTVLHDIESTLATTVRQSASQAKLFQIAFLQGLRRRWEGSLLGRQNRLAELCKEKKFLNQKKMDEEGKSQGNMDGEGDGEATNGEIINNHIFKCFPKRPRHPKYGTTFGGASRFYLETSVNERENLRDEGIYTAADAIIAADNSSKNRKCELLGAGKQLDEQDD